MSTEAKPKNTPESRMTDNVEGVFNEHWREKILEGCKRGKVGKAKSGRWVGAFPPPYGYKRVGEKQDSRLEIDESEAEIVRNIFQWYVCGDETGKPLTAYEITGRLSTANVRPPMRGRPSKGGKWYPATVDKILKNRTFTGEWTYKGNGDAVVVQVSAILEDPRLYETAQARCVENKRLSPRRTWREYLMRGRLNCRCGKNMVGAATGGKRRPDYRLYRCSSVGNWQNAQCHAGNLPAEFIEAKAWEWIYGILKDPKSRRKGFAEMQRDAEKQADPLRRRLASIEKQIAECESDAQALVSNFLRSRKDKRKLPAIVQEAVARQVEEIEERRARLEKTWKIIQDNLADMVVSDEEMAHLDSVFEEMGQRLADYDLGVDGATFEDKMRTFDMLKVRGQLVEADGAKAVLFTYRRPGASKLVPIDIIDNYLKY
jgi:site-specific DNA recombinase